MLAVNRLEADLMARLNLYMTVGLTLIAICVLVWIVLRIRIWFVESEDSDEPYQDMLTQFHQLKREGELSDEEYRLISERLAAPQPAATGAAQTHNALPKPAAPESHQSTDQQSK